MTTIPFFSCCFGIAFLVTAPCSMAAGLTLITHGFNGNTDEWVIPMAQAQSQMPPLDSTRSSCYEVSLKNPSRPLEWTSRLLAPFIPYNQNDSGEIFVKVDWSDLDGGSLSTTEVAQIVLDALLSDEFLSPDGAPLAVSLPIHLIGHSRGGSLMAEVSRLLGEQGIWVDQLTTLDPHPCNNDGFGGGLESLVCTAVDGSVKVYENVLFADNYWQEESFLFPIGERINGAYNRFLDNLFGGHPSSHADVHLWYHGTIDFATPLEIDGKELDDEMREEWYQAGERNGQQTGYSFSRIRGGNRFAGNVRGGLHPALLPGEMMSLHRTPLPQNQGRWANPVEIRLQTSGSSWSVEVKYHSLAESQFQVILDRDANPFNGFSLATAEPRILPSTSEGFLGEVTTSVFQNAQPLAGDVFVGCLLTLGTEHRQRILYDSTPISLPPRITRLEKNKNSEGHLQLTTLLNPRWVHRIQRSRDLKTWTSILTQPAGEEEITLDVPIPDDFEGNEFFRIIVERQ